MERLLLNSPGILRLATEDANGQPADATGPGGSGLPTAAVTNGAGVPTGGSPYVATDVGVGLYEATIPAADLTLLDVFDVTWTFRPTGATADHRRRVQFRTVGAWYFDLRELRELEGLSSTTEVSAARLAVARSIAEEKFEEETGIAWVPRGDRIRIDGTGGRSLWLPYRHPTRLVSATIDGVAFTSTELTDVELYETGELWRETAGAWGRGFRNVTLHVEHGRPNPPAPLARAAKKYARSLIVEGPLDTERATAMTTDLGTFRITTAGRDGPTGIPEVDAELEAWTPATRKLGFA